jgi:hypothetical protein
MAYKVLGHVAPSATTATTLYTVPGAVSTVCSTLTVCNQNTASITYRVAVRPAAATLAGLHYVAYDVNLPGNSTDTLTLGLTLATTDVVTVYTSTANVSFGLYGSEA